jgi:RNA polymerase primary sigma factor
LQKELLNMTEKEINKIVSENLNYVKSVANQYKGKGVEFDDLVSEGTLAMLMAARKFQAGPFVHKAISQAIDKQSGVYRLPKDQKKYAPRNADKAVSVDAPLSANNPYTLLDILNDPDVKIADDTLNIEMMKKKMAESIADLLPREKEIITKFYGIGVPKETMAEIAEDMGLKRERVRQIRNLTIRRLNRSIRHQALRNYFKR